MTLAELISQAHHLLIDFDGPICSVFAGYPAVAIADKLREIIRRHCGGMLPPGLAELHGDPLRLLVDVAQLGDDELTRRVADACRDAEATAVNSAAATPGADEVLRTASGSGRRVTVVSNNATAAIGDYLQAHELSPHVAGIAARFDGMNPRLLKPHPFLVQRAIDGADEPSSRALFIGDSITDIEAGIAAGIPTIGYANKPGKHQRLTDAGATVVIDSMRLLAAELRSTTARPAQ
ncbi:HAD hydrolase-like protein [Actinoplanes sp. NPDC023714]|uniref:HAD family hydrolase n=1 Tax=Actinoplanes sp. NPDC023714 TaxID=3154322 RepID=UPI0033FAED11